MLFGTKKNQKDFSMFLILNIYRTKQATHFLTMSMYWCLLVSNSGGCRSTSSIARLCFPGVVETPALGSNVERTT